MSDVIALSKVLIREVVVVRRSLWVIGLDIAKSYLVEFF